MHVHFLRGYGRWRAALKMGCTQGLDQHGNSTVHGSTYFFTNHWQVGPSLPLLSLPTHLGCGEPPQEQTCAPTKKRKRKKKKGRNVADMLVRMCPEGEKKGLKKGRKTKK